MDSLLQDLQCYRLIFHQPSSLKTSMTSSFKELSALETNYKKYFQNWYLSTRLLKDHLDDILPTITAIVNESLLSGVFPTCLKQSLIRPLLKKADLDEEILKNYRPIANIPFLAKIIEKVVALQTY